MTADELVAFWGGIRMAAVSTVSASGRVHAAPLEVSLIGSQFHVPTFGDSVRLADHRANARCAITAWDDTYRAVIAYGRVDSLPAGQRPRWSTSWSAPPASTASGRHPATTRRLTST
jgi:hypothetical protein